jgi:hypothetical protein
LATGVLVGCLGLAGVLAFVTASPSGTVSPLQGAGVAAGFLCLLVIATLLRGGLAATLFSVVLYTVLAAPFLMIIAVLGMSVGPELFAAGLLFQVTAEPTPPGRWVVWQMPAQRGKGQTGLMHSASYHSAAALDIVARWLAAVPPRRGADEEAS